MNIQNISIDSSELRRLLGAASGDAALLYLYIRGGNDPASAEAALHMGEGRLACSMATLRQLGLWQEEKRTVIASGERPNYSERDVLQTMDTDPSFRSLYGEVQRRLGRQLNTEELKVLLSLVRYLGLPVDVICVLVTYCQERARRKGSIRNPSLRTIEKEAYAWAERGIDTMEEAAAFIQAQNVYHSRLSGLCRLLQIRGRALTAAEEKYAASWLDMGFDDEAITMAYERTCLNTGGLSWAYMNKILTRWHEAGLHTSAQVRAGDRKGGSNAGQRQFDADEQAAIRRMLEEG
ncbi:MAG: DnaD domain protein [Oscillospiraceae bacterium]|nr:DnaD domain protein [Oscillospiraceae bacterium]